MSYQRHPTFRHLVQSLWSGRRGLTRSLFRTRRSLPRVSQCSTFASDAPAAGVSVFELARNLGTSVRMIERHYGALLDGAGAGIAGRLDALDAERDRAGDHARDDR